MKKLYRALNSIRNWVIIFVTSFTVLLCFLQIILRYFSFLRQFAWGDEIIRLTSIWAVFLGISIGVRENSHFTVTLLEEHIKNPKVRKYFLMAIDVIVVFVLAVVCYQGIIYTASSTASYLQNVRIPIALFYAAIPVGAAYCIIEYIYKFIYGPSYKEKMLAKEARNG